ncbi:hypothetical protein DICPUDRAFT_86619 [Dictyostelium purpureum]|uniref:Short-chain dehydrogenase/reductase SDR n=1 Tax=Dictyostelium purpureum TaxID=5786 RepID=F0ZCU4_DICPU|nr:uncharacterized protein DICPUDRAFT_86619 [Dictyostelium purpureum]EGC38219.1 hypothetical protein DICPUDRAFT_86619 [Dictyostelium purpureum]|eukprot:XP_003285257.1 hypothetical protein DICPUDRAFT_86619 [Dictyostelium purpureum]
MTQKDQKVFYITGASKGFGLILVNQLLERGFNVAATSRNKEQLVNVINNKLVTEENFLPLQVDLTSDESVKKSIEDTISKFTRIDVIINNAGYGQFGTIEELTDKEVRDNFECNLFGVISVVRNALPHLRTNKFFANGPRIINISSIAGFTGSFPGCSIYSSTKFALEGLTEGLGADLKEFGIHVSSVKPGYFRTSFLEKDSMAGPANPIKEYTAVRHVQEMHQGQINGNQSGDPEKGCKVIIDHALSENPSTHLFLGPDSMKYAQSKIESIQNDIKTNHEVASSTDFSQ